MHKGPALLENTLLALSSTFSHLTETLQVSIFSSVKAKKTTQSSRYVVKTRNNLCKADSTISQQMLVLTYKYQLPSFQLEVVLLSISKLAALILSFLSVPSVHMQTCTVGSRKQDCLSAGAFPSSLKQRPTDKHTHTEATVTPASTLKKILVNAIIRIRCFSSATM